MERRVAPIENLGTRTMHPHWEDPPSGAGLRCGAGLDAERYACFGGGATEPMPVSETAA